MIAQQLMRLEVRIIKGIPAEEDSGAGKGGETAERRGDRGAQPVGLRAVESPQERPITAVPRIRQHDNLRLAFVAVLRVHDADTATRVQRFEVLLVALDVREVEARVRENLRMGTAVGRRVGRRRVGDLAAP